MIDTSAIPRLSDAELLEAQYALARVKFEAFLPYIKVLDPPPSGQGSTDFVPWPHLLEMARGFARHRLVVIVKAKQIGISWELAAYAYWTAAYHFGSPVLEYSMGQLYAKELLEKSVFIHRHLPPGLQEEAEITTEAIRFPRVDSRILTLPSTPSAGVGFTGALVIMDEADFHEYLSENYDAAAKPTVDAGGQLIMASTVNPLKVDSAFQQRVRHAGDKVAGENGFARYFFPYDVRPGREGEWYRRAQAEADNPLVFAKNYPQSLEEALAPSSGLAYFDAEALQVMMQKDAREPSEVLLGGLHRIWRRAEVGGRYILGADTAWGQTGSYNVAVVLDWTTGEQVAELRGRPHPDEMAQAVVSLHKMYNHAYMGVERAGMGIREAEGVVVAEKVEVLQKECDCRGRMYYADREAKEPKKPGWQTDPKTRPVILERLAEAVRNRGVVLRSRETVGEMMSFIRNDQGRPEAAQGAHDDGVMASAITLAMREYSRWWAVSPRAQGAAPLLLPRR